MKKQRRGLDRHNVLHDAPSMLNLIKKMIFFGAKIVNFGLDRHIFDAKTDPFIPFVPIFFLYFKHIRIQIL